MKGERCEEIERILSKSRGPREGEKKQNLRVPFGCGHGLVMEGDTAAWAMGLIYHSQLQLSAAFEALQSSDVTSLEVLHTLKICEWF